jgi:endothelin-converting enzyme/putative endopeptidase
MRNFLSLLAVALFAVTAALAQTNNSASTDVVKPIKSFDLNAIDKSIDPCNDFYQYACGTWMKQNPIPPDQAAWGRFNELHQNNQIILRNILDKQSANNSARSSTDQKIGDYYSSCMDESGIEEKGTKAHAGPHQRCKRQV